MRRVCCLVLVFLGLLGLALSQSCVESVSWWRRHGTPEQLNLPLHFWDDGTRTLCGLSAAQLLDSSTCAVYLANVPLCQLAQQFSAMTLSLHHLYNTTGHVDLIYYVDAAEMLNGLNCSASVSRQLASQEDVDVLKSLTKNLKRQLQHTDCSSDAGPESTSHDNDDDEDHVIAVIVAVVVLAALFALVGVLLAVSMYRSGNAMTAAPAADARPLVEPGQAGAGFVLER